MQIAYIITEDSKLFGLFDVIDMIEDANLLAASFGITATPLTIKLVGRASRSLAYQKYLTIQIDEVIGQTSTYDLVLIPAFNKGDYAGYIDKYQDIRSWLLGAYNAGATLCSLCSGAFLLASTGLLDGKYCTTHWAGKDIFTQLFPEVNLVTQYILTQEERLITSGGSTNALLAVLYIINNHFGAQLAHQLSKLYEIDLDRFSQSQYEIFVPNKSHQDEEIRKAQQLIEENFATIATIDEVRQTTR